MDFLIAFLGAIVFFIMSIFGLAFGDSKILAWSIIGLITFILILHLLTKEDDKQRAVEQKRVKEMKDLFQEKYIAQKQTSQHAKLLMTLYGKPSKQLEDCLQVFLDEKGDTVLVDYKYKIATSSFSFEAMKQDVDFYSYHPSKAVYTGASSGGIHAGGVHTESAYYTKSRIATEYGFVYNKAYQDFVTMFIVIDKDFLEDIKKNEILAPFIRKSQNSKRLKDDFGSGKDVLVLADFDSSFSKELLDVAKRSDSYSAMNAINLSNASLLFPLDICNKIADELNKTLENIQSA